MKIVDIITKKKNNIELNEEEIKYVIENFVNGTIMDYQMSSLLMAICINGMSLEETSLLTKYMIDSGNRLDLSMLEPIVDKHSTGGIGDKTTLIITPIVASCGVNVAKMSGRSLGYTGGTIDKLESIPGFNTHISSDEFVKQIKEIGLGIISQTNDLVLADKKMYALRDVTGTVESIPLIASSIMSKKIASGSKNIIIDIKVGSGALVHDIESARMLANYMISIGKSNGVKVKCLITNMDIPLGMCVGNSLEIEETMDILKNNRDCNLTKLCLELSTYMVMLGLDISYEDANEKVETNFKNGNAYNKFLEFIKYQGGNIKLLPKAKYLYNVPSNKEGYITNINALNIGKLSFELGAGRLNKEDSIDYSVGIKLNKEINDYVKVGESLMTIYSNKELKSINDDIFTISDNPIEYKLIYEIIE